MGRGRAGGCWATPRHSAGSGVRRQAGAGAGAGCGEKKHALAWPQARGRHARAGTLETWKPVTGVPPPRAITIVPDTIPLKTLSPSWGTHTPRQESHTRKNSHVPYHCLVTNSLSHFSRSSHSPPPRAVYRSVSGIAGSNIATEQRLRRHDVLLHASNNMALIFRGWRSWPCQSCIASFIFYLCAVTAPSAVLGSYSPNL